MADVSFDDQVKFLAGPITAYSSELPQFYSDGVRDVIQRIAAVKPELLKQFSNEVAVPSGGLSLTDTAKILDVNLAGFSAHEIEPKERFNAWDVDSIYYAHSTAPVYYTMNQTLHVIPGGDTYIQAPSDDVVDACILELNGQSSTNQGKNKKAQTGQKTSTSKKISTAIKGDAPVNSGL
jgi:hypothetical protein